MAKLLWDQVSERLYEVGLDRGVLYLTDNTGIAWNGLTGLDEDFSEDTTEPQYYDGIKYFDRPLFGDFSASLRAYTYPDEFLEYEGFKFLSNGIGVDAQDVKRFGLSYRTTVGNDSLGVDLGYKIHIVYNLSTVADTTTYESLTESLNLTEFSWAVTAVPVKLINYRPTAHVILDSRFLPFVKLDLVESILYGVGGDNVTVYDGAYAATVNTDLIDGGTPTDVGIELPSGSVIFVYDGATPSTTNLELLDGGTASSINLDIPYESDVSIASRLPTIQELVTLLT